MKINTSRNEIVLSKTEYAKAIRVGTVEFEELCRAKQMFPRAKIVVQKVSKGSYHNITKKFILDYVKENDGQTLHDHFEDLFKRIGESYKDEADEECKEISFFSIRAEFLNKYPQFMNKNDREKYEKKKKEKNNAKETSAKQIKVM